MLVCFVKKYKTTELQLVNSPASHLCTWRIPFDIGWGQVAFYAVVEHCHLLQTHTLTICKSNWVFQLPEALSWRPKKGKLLSTEPFNEHKIQHYSEHMVDPKYKNRVSIWRNNTWTRYNRAQTPRGGSTNIPQKQSLQGSSRYPPQLLFEQTVYRLLPSSPDILGIAIEQ